MLLCVFAVMLVFNFVTPLLDDDFAYAFSFSDFERIESIKSIFPSMSAHRSLANGRVVSHFLVQLSGDKRAEIPRYNSLSKYSAMTGLEDVGEYFGFWVNVVMEKYYGLDYIAAIPAEY